MAVPGEGCLLVQLLRTTGNVLWMSVGYTAMIIMGAEVSPHASGAHAGVEPTAGAGSLRSVF